jgi:hypothetical protein
MGIDEQYEQYLFEQAATNLTNYADLIIQQIEDNDINPRDFAGFKKALGDFNKLTEMAVVKIR